MRTRRYYLVRSAARLVFAATATLVAAGVVAAFLWVVVPG